MLAGLCGGQGEIGERRVQMTELIRDNTERLDQLAMLLEENKAYQRSPDRRQKNLVRMQRSLDRRQKNLVHMQRL